MPEKIKVLLVLGGVRVGDTFHAIPFFNFLHEQDKYSITWVCGTYARDAVTLLTQHSHLKGLFNKIIPLDDGFPGNYLDIENFRDKVFNCYHLKGVDKFDLIISEPTIIDATIKVVSTSLGTVGRVCEYEWLKLLDDTPSEEDYIVVQGYTRSDWKNLDSILNVDYPLPTKSVGLPNETLLHGAEDLRGKPIEEVALAIRNCRVFVGQHSSMTILAYYLGVPTIALHFMHKLFRLSTNKKDCIDLAKPDIIEIRKAIDKLLEVT